MRVIVPYTEIHPLADRALRELVPDAERVYLGRDDFAYARLLAELWQPFDDILIVEHDIVLTADALFQARHCPCLYSVSPYRGPCSPGCPPTMLERSLGCTRFSARLMAQLPDAVQRANSISDGGSVCPAMHWKRLDARLWPIIQDSGYPPHLHSEVIHHHLYPEGCACGEDHE